jgi:hypothetical protein
MILHNLQKYSLGGDGYRQPSMVPSPLGDYYKVSDVEEILKTLDEKIIPKKMKCRKKIEIEKSNGIAHTYCDLEIGHEGVCK